MLRWREREGERDELCKLTTDFNKKLRNFVREISGPWRANYYTIISLRDKRLSHRE